MVDATRALLDELMGKDRNLPNELRNGQHIRYDDPQVCKHSLAGLCPNRLFKNTRSDLGPCPHEIHDDHIEWPNIMEDYNKEGERDHERLEQKLLTYMEELIRDMDRKIIKAKERAEKESAPRKPRSEDQARLDELQARAKDALERSQKAGEGGDVDASMSLANQAEDIKQSHDRLLRQVTQPDRVMMVCQICGVFISSTDNEQQRLDHLTGKQYLGWKAIRDKYAELTAKLSAPRAPASRSDRDGGHRSSSREAGREPRRGDEGDRRRDDSRGEQRARYDERDSRDSRRYDDRERERERERSPRRDDRRDRDSGRDRNYDSRGAPSRGPSGGSRSGGYERERPRDDYERRR